MSIGPLAVRWYSLAYIAGIILGWMYISRLQRRMTHLPMRPSQLDDMIMWAVFGVILGGRLGYVLFYNPGYYLAHPMEILTVWEGGMSFHGGMLGVIIAFYLFSRRHGFPFLSVMDLVAMAAPVGLFFGRLANFINGELFGRVTDHPWGMVFPRGGPSPRHPSQLYEAVLEGAVLFILLFVVAWFRDGLDRRGLISGLFLLGYGMARFSVEFVREPDAHLGLLAIGLSMGQWLCLPMILVGLFLVVRSKHYTNYGESS